jgi:hypothetical protein
VLAEQATKVLDLVGQGWQVPVRGCPLLLAGSLLAEQLLFSVAQRCRVLEVLGVDGGLFVVADLRDLLVEVAHVRFGTHAILQGPNARLDQVQPVEELRQRAGNSSTGC